MTTGSTAKRIVLMRHAKSSWAEAGTKDHDRPLNRRGRLAASLMGAWLAEQDWRLDLALISSSQRTRESWARIAPMLPEPLEAEIRPELYLAGPETLLALVRALSENAGAALILGHNPGLESFAAKLETPKGGLAGPRRMPTAAVAVFTLAGPWREAAHGEAVLTDWEQPKSLV